MFNKKNWSVKEQIQKRVQIESVVECQLYSDPEEKNHLEFAEMPPLPKYEELEIKKDNVGWQIFFIKMLLELRP